MKSIWNRMINPRFLLLLLITVVIVFLYHLQISSSYYFETEEESGKSKACAKVKYESKLKIEQISTSVTNESFYSFGSVNPSSVFLRLRGGLGNQLFQYACHYGIARKNNWPLYTFVSVKLSKSFREFTALQRDFALDYFNIPLYKWNMVDESWKISDNIEYINDSAILSGLYSNDKVISQGIVDYCLSEAFFAPYKEEIKEMFTWRVIPSSLTNKNLRDVTFDSEHDPKKPCFVSPSVQQWLSLIESENESVGVHIRRTDFIPIDTVVPISFQKESMERISSILDKAPTFFIFTDDVHYAKNEFMSTTEATKNGSIYLVSMSNLSSLDEFYLMSKCKHNIIPNSSFGWWAAYLNANPKKIVIAAHQRLRMLDFIFAGGAAAAERDFNKFMYRHLYYPYEWITVDPFM